MTIKLNIKNYIKNNNIIQKTMNNIISKIVINNTESNSIKYKSYFIQIH